MRTIVSHDSLTALFRALVPEVTVTEVATTAEGLLVTAFVPTPSASCPHCGHSSTRVHSYYVRQPHDMPPSDQPVRLLLHARRFRCVNPACSAVTFSEHLPSLIAPAAQRTTRLNAEIRAIITAYEREYTGEEDDSTNPTDGE